MAPRFAMTRRHGTVRLLVRFQQAPSTLRGFLPGGPGPGRTIVIHLVCVLLLKACAEVIVNSNACLHHPSPLFFLSFCFNVVIVVAISCHNQWIRTIKSEGWMLVCSM